MHIPEQAHGKGTDNKYAPVNMWKCAAPWGRFLENKNTTPINPPKIVEIKHCSLHSFVAMCTKT